MRLPWQKKSALEEGIEDLDRQLRNLTPGSEEYMELADKLDKLKCIDRDNHSRYENRNQLNVNTLLVVGGSIVEILLMMHYEELHSFTTKAMSRIIKPKI